MQRGLIIGQKILKVRNTIKTKAINRIIEHPQEKILIVRFNTKRNTIQMMPTTNRMRKSVIKASMNLSFYGEWFTILKHCVN
jgi:hypothetical protein